jgi:outer membrane protein TolC
MARWLPCFVLGYCCISNAVHAEPLREREAVQHICRSGVDTAVAAAQRARGQAGVIAAEVLPNPSLVVEHQRSLAGATDRESIVGLSVPLGIGGQRWLLQDAAHARRTQSTLEAQAGLFEAALSFREAYALAVAAQARARVLTENQAALDALALALHKLTRGGEAAGYDQLRQTTYARIHRQALEAADITAGAARTQLEAWLEGEVGEPLPNEKALEADTSGPAADTLEVRGLEAQARADELTARAARRRSVPDINLFGGYRSVAAGDETGHGLALSLELPITLFDHGRGEAARATSDAQLARASAQRLRKRQAATVRAAKVSLERLAASVAAAAVTSRDALALRDKATQLYAAGEASITELLEAYRVAEEAQLAELALRERHALTRLALMRATGSMFDAELDRQCRGGAR